MYIPKAKSGSIVRANFACIQYAQTGIFVVIFDPISERDIPGRASSWIRIFVICKHENQLRQKIEQLSDGNVKICSVQLIKLSWSVYTIPPYAIGFLPNVAPCLTDFQAILSRTPNERILPESGNI